MTPLMRCLTECQSKEAQTEIVKLLVSHDCDVNLPDEKGNTALFYALQELRDDLAIFLVLYGASINCKNKEGVYPLSYAHNKLKSAIQDISEIVQKQIFDEEDARGKMMKETKVKD